jgi:hypothetical protein
MAYCQRVLTSSPQADLVIPAYMELLIGFDADMVSSCVGQKVQNYFYSVQILWSCRFIIIPTYKISPAGVIFKFAISSK